MAEEIRPTREVARGFISTARPGRSVLGELGRALGTLTDLGESAVLSAAEKEQAEVEDLLSSPLITQEEVAEIESEATFPLARLKARNRRGSLMAQQAFEEIQDKVARAPDAPTARKILRESQRDLLVTSDDAAVQAGIRERFADMAPRMLSEASARRVVAREREERISVAEDQRLSLESSDTLAFANTLIGQIEEESVAGGDVSALMDTATVSIENFWLSGDDEDIGENVNTTEALRQIDLITDNVKMDEAEKLKFTRLRERIEAGVEAALGDPNAIRLKAQKQAHQQWGQALTDWSLANPGQYPPAELTRPYFNTATTEAERRASVTFVDSLPGDGPVQGVTGTKQAVQARGILLKQISNADGLFEGETGPEVLEFFDTLVAEMDPGLRKDEAELRRVLTDASKRAINFDEERRKEQEDTEAQADQAIQDQLQALLSGAVSTEDGESVDLAELERVERAIKAQRAPILRRLRRKQIQKAADELGIPLSSMANTSTR